MVERSRNFTMKELHAVCFDADGVLIDSVKPHLKICEDKARDYGLKLNVPDVDGFRQMLRRGVKISPMNRMFEAMGFPQELADRAFAAYKTDFMRVYRPTLYPGADRALASLKDAGLRLGLVTANVLANVETVLGPSFRFFEPNGIHTQDRASAPNKTEALRMVCSNFGLEPGECLYVGDQPADWHAARETGMPFLGTTYGWGITKEDREFPTVDDVSGIADYILRKVPSPESNA